MSGPIFWHQGLFLQPQHFQLLERQTADQDHRLPAPAAPWAWGLLSYAINEEALKRNRVEVTALKAWFQDGAFVQVPTDAALAARTVDPKAVPAGKSFMVRIALKRFNPDGGNAALSLGPSPMFSQPAPEKAPAPPVWPFAQTPAAQPPAAPENPPPGEALVDARYIAPPDPESVPDLYAGGPAAKVRRMFYAPRIVFDFEGGETAPFDMIPLLRLTREGDGLVLDQAYIPPTPRIGADGPLHRLLADLSAQIAARARQLEEYKLHGRIASGEFDQGYMLFLLALLTMNRSAPLLDHAIRNPDAHPFHLYGLLLALIGELSTFAEDVGALSEGPDGTRLAPVYNHEDLFACFDAARKVISRLIENLGTSVELLIRLERKGRAFTVDPPARAFSPDFAYWLVVHSASDPAELEAEVAGRCKLASATLLHTLLVKAVHGVGLKRNLLPPAGLPKRGDTLYFLIDSDSPLWEDVVESRSLSLFWDSPPEDAAVSLAVVRKR